MLLTVKRWLGPCPVRHASEHERFWSPGPHIYSTSASCESTVEEASKILGLTARSSLLSLLLETTLGLCVVGGWHDSLELLMKQKLGLCRRPLIASL